MTESGRETRVRVKCGHFAGREGTLVEPQPGDAPGKLRVRFDTGLAGFFKYDDVEFLPAAERFQAQPLHPDDPRGPSPLRALYEEYMRTGRFLPEPEPVRDIPAVLAGIGRWQQQDPMKRRVHFVAEPVTYGNIRGHVVTLHVVFPGDQSPYLMTITAPATEAEVVAALDRLVAQPPGTRASMTTPDAEALATHAGGAD